MMLKKVYKREVDGLEQRQELVVSGFNSYELKPNDEHEGMIEITCYKGFALESALVCVEYFPKRGSAYDDNWEFSGAYIMTDEGKTIETIA